MLRQLSQRFTSLRRSLSPADHPRKQKTFTPRIEQLERRELLAIVAGTTEYDDPAQTVQVPAGQEFDVAAVEDWIPSTETYNRDLTDPFEIYSFDAVQAMVDTIRAEGHAIATSHPRIFIKIDNKADLRDKIAADVELVQWMQEAVDLAYANYGIVIVDPGRHNREPGAQPVILADAIIYQLGEIPGVTYADPDPTNTQLTIPEKYGRDGVRHLVQMASRDDAVEKGDFAGVVPDSSERDELWQSFIDKPNEYIDATGAIIKRPYNASSLTLDPKFEDRRVAIFDVLSLNIDTQYENIEYLGMPLGYDWLYDLMSPDERETVALKLLENAELTDSSVKPSIISAGACLLGPLAVTGDGIDDARASRLLQLFHEGLVMGDPAELDEIRWNFSATQLFAPEGPGHSGLGYSMLNNPFYPFLEAWYDQTGEDYFKLPFFQSWVFHATQLSGNEYEHIDKYQQARIRSWGGILSNNVMRMMEMSLARSNPTAAALAKYHGSQSHRGRLSARLIYMLRSDPTIDAISPGTLGLPTTAHFRGVNNVVARSSWEGSDATWVWFQSPTWTSTRDTGPLNDLEIWKNGAMLLGKHEQKHDYDGGNRTNTLVLYDENQPNQTFIPQNVMDRSRNRPLGIRLDNGASLTQLNKNLIGYNPGLQFFEEKEAQYVYAFGDGRQTFQGLDASWTNDTLDLDNWTRQFIWFSDQNGSGIDTFFVLDRIETPSDTVSAQVPLHFGPNPEIRDKETNTGLGDGAMQSDGVWKYENQNANRIVVTNTVVTDAGEAHGRLFVDTLLPREPTYYRMGGIGTRNVDLFGNLRQGKLASSLINGSPDDPSNIVQGMWRVQIASPQSGRNQTFLNVMQATDSSVQTPNSTILLEGTGIIGALVDKYVALFNASEGPLVAGTVTMPAETSGAFELLITDLAPGTPYTITLNGTVINQTSPQASMAGTISLNSVALIGGQLLEIRAENVTPPSSPTNLAAVAVSTSQVDLTWTAAVDPEDGIHHYNIYRDGTKVGSSETTSYQDTGLASGTTYSYEVSAVNGALAEGQKSSPPVTATTLANAAGITVTPISGLTTTEAGGTASFTVALNSQPAADVVIGISSSDTTEGTAPNELTFTGANWGTAQTVTVTGVDDVLVDGDVTYTIVLAAAVSSDADYNGIDPADVTVSNTDDDNPLEPVDLGAIQFRVVENQDPSAGDLLYRIETTRAGLLTLEAMFDAAGGAAALTLYDATGAGTPLAFSSLINNHQRIDWETGAGTTYYVKLSGVNSSVDLRLTNLVQPNGNAVAAYGTSSADTFQFAADAPYRLVINGVSYEFDPSVIGTVTFDGGQGADTADLTGSSGYDKAVAYWNWGKLTGTGYEVTVSNTTSIDVHGGGGQADEAHLYDSAEDDTFTAYPNEGTLTGTGFSNSADGFHYVHGYGKYGGQDVAYLWDSPGSADKFTGRPSYSKMEDLAETDFFSRAKSFATVYAYSTGGEDQAHLRGSRNSEVFYAYATTDADDPEAPTLGKMIGTDFYYEAEGFKYLHGYALQGGTDVAHLYDSAADDTFRSEPGGGKKFAKLFDEARTYQSRAKFFDYVHAYAVNGGYDTAMMYGLTGDDTLIGHADYTRMFGYDYNYRAKFFEAVDAESKPSGALVGGNDRAYLFDSAGDDLLNAIGSKTQIDYGSSLLEATFFAWTQVTSRDGSDTRHVETIDFTLETLGAWLDI